MNDKKKTKEQLLKELKEIRKKVAEIETVETKHKVIESDLKRFKLLCDNAKDLVYICDNKGNILYVNKTFEKFSGYKPEKFLGKSFAPLFKGEDLKKAENLYKKTLKGESPQEEITFSKTGILCEYKNLPLRNTEGEIIGVIGTARDITERKRVEEEFRLQAEIINNMAEGTLLVRFSDGTILYANPKFEAMFGYEPRELNGKHVSILNDRTDKTQDKIIDDVFESLRKHGAWKGEVHNVKKDGTPFWCSATVSTLKHRRYGNVAVTVQTDITEHKKANEALRLTQFTFRMPPSSLLERSRRLSITVKSCAV